MGTYCCYRIEKKEDKDAFGSTDLEQSYALYGWLIDCRNYSGVPPLQTEENACSVRTYSEYEAEYGYVFEGKTLLDFYYDQEVEDRRTWLQTGPFSGTGRHTCAPGEGTKMTYREFLPGFWFEILESLEPDDRFVIWTT